LEIVYSKWLPDSKTDESRLEDLLSIFSSILVQTNGDIEEALDWLEQMGIEYQLFDKDLTFGDFVDELKRQGYIAEKEGMQILTSKGSRKIRSDMLRKIFSGLKPDFMSQTNREEVLINSASLKNSNSVIRFPILILLPL